jgi:hypothetical protein
MNTMLQHLVDLFEYTVKMLGQFRAVLNLVLLCRHHDIVYCTFGCEEITDVGTVSFR